MADQVEKYHDRIYQLDELILDIYNAVYVKSNKYKTKFIDVADLKMNRFKMTDYDLDIIFEKTKIQYAENHPTGIKIKGKNVEQIIFKRKGDTHMSSIRIVPYFNKEVINNMTDPVNVNQIMKTLLSEIVVNDRSNNILLPVINVDVTGADLLEYEKLETLVDKNKLYSIEITEKFYSMTTLDKFLKDYSLDARILKTIIYQVVDVLYQVSTTYPGFKYNQLFPEMIDCYLKEKDNVTFPELKLSNFYLAEIDEVVTNNYLKSSEISIPNVGLAYGDLYQLLNNLWNNNSIDIKKYPELVSLFDVILPKKIRSNDLYLTKKLWDTLTDEEKFDLKIKNIRNSTFFTSKDSLINTNFVSTKDGNDELSGGKTESDELITKKTETIVKISDDEKSELDDNSIPVVKKINTTVNIVSDNISKNDLDQGITSSNKKYSNNDIDNMGNKKLNKNDLSKDNDKSPKRIRNKVKNMVNNENISDDIKEDITEEITEEATEERVFNGSRQSRIINVSDTDIGSKKASANKLKTYRGKRHIGNTDNVVPEMNNFNRPMQMDNQMPHDYNNSFQINGVPSRINSIGSLLGANPNEYHGKNQNPNYNQIAQQMSQQYQGDMGQSYAHLPQNIQNQIPMPIQNPIGQMPTSQQPDNEAMYRYLAATNGQMPNQPQIDPSMMAYMQQQNMQMQQQNMQMPQPNMQMPQQMAYPSNVQNMTQNGGKRNPFFFQ